MHHSTFALLLLAFCLISLPCLAQMADRILVDKSDKTLFLYNANKELARFPVVFGPNPVGHKQQEGDGRTPEGQYIIDFKNSHSAFYKALHISYPNANDVAEATKRGVAPGGAIMIHGQKNGFGWANFVMQHINWTAGCIALSNKNIDTVWARVATGTPIEIRP